MTEIEADDTIIGRNAGERVVIGVRKTRDEPRVDCRLWFVGDGEELHPTSRGLRVPVDVARKVAAAIVECCDRIETGQRQ